ncbi:hypothetical protein AAHA92_05897 [Salvia divinorum]|uniref:Uncharacterized protein n=1 Tax=Salvia divinorum TaxID=28513 RepID=A0ABD1I662_SALDI
MRSNCKPNSIFLSPPQTLDLGAGNRPLRLRFGPTPGILVLSSDRKLLFRLEHLNHIAAFCEDGGGKP